MKKPVSRVTFSSLILAAGISALPCFANNGSFTEICDTPIRMAAFLGPRLLAEPEVKSIEKLILAANKQYTARSFKDAVEIDGLFASSPYLPADAKAEEKIEKICVVFATGGVAFSVKQAVERNQTVADKDERARAIAPAIRESDRHCYIFLEERRP